MVAEPRWAMSGDAAWSESPVSIGSSNVLHRRLREPPGAIWKLSVGAECAVLCSDRQVDCSRPGPPWLVFYSGSDRHAESPSGISPRRRCANPSLVDRRPWRSIRLRHARLHGPVGSRGERTGPAGDDLTIDVAEANEPWTGDLDGMIERGFIRVLAVYSKTYFSWTRVCSSVRCPRSLPSSRRT